MQTKQDLLKFMAARGACLPATDYVMTHHSSSALTIALECDQPDWLVWLLSRYSPRSLDAFAFRCADRAVRKHTPRALYKAGLGGYANALRALGEIVDEASARTGATAAETAAEAAAEAAEWAAWAAGAAWAAWAAERAAGAAWAAERAAGAAGAAEAAERAAERAAGAAEAAERAAERAQQLTELRQIVKEVLK